MQYLLPNGLMVAPVAPALSVAHHASTAGIRNEHPSAAVGFAKVYLEELTEQAYRNEGGIDGLARIARTDVTELTDSTGIAGGANPLIRRFKVHYRDYNISVTIEDDNSGRLTIRAS